MAIHSNTASDYGHFFFPSFFFFLFFLPWGGEKTSHDDIEIIGNFYELKNECMKA